MTSLHDRTPQQTTDLVRERMYANDRASKALGLASMAAGALIWMRHGAAKANDRKVLAAIQRETDRRLRAMPWPPAA